MADSQGPPQVQKAIVSLVALKKRKCLSQFRDAETRSSLAPHLHALKRRQYAQLQAILGCLNPPRLREVLDASNFLKYFHCFFRCAIPTFSTFFFFHFVLLSQFFHFVNDFFDSELMSLGLKLYLIHGKILNI